VSPMARTADWSASVASHSERTASSPYSSTANADAAVVAPTAMPAEAAARGRRGSRPSPRRVLYAAAIRRGMAANLTPRAARVATPILARWVRSFAKERPRVL